jgi:hypothetical protein
MIIMLTAIATSWLILPPNQVIRNDGTLVEVSAALGPKEEFTNFIKLFKDIRVVALFPVCFASNYCKPLFFHPRSEADFKSTLTKDPSLPISSMAERVPSFRSLLVSDPSPVLSSSVYCSTNSLTDEG